VSIVLSDRDAGGGVGYLAMIEGLRRERYASWLRLSSAMTR
jgi:hypothetical protein